MTRKITGKFIPAITAMTIFITSDIDILRRPLPSRQVGPACHPGFTAASYILSSIQVDPIPGVDITSPQDRLTLVLDLGKSCHDLVHAGDFILVVHGTTAVPVGDNGITSTG